MGFQVAKYVLGIIFVVLFFTRIVRPMINWMTTTAEVVPAMAMASATEAEVEEPKALGTQTQQLRQSVGDFVTADPKFAASILRKWMKDKH